MKNEVCDECQRSCEDVWLSKYAGIKEVPHDWYICGYCRADEEKAVQ